MVWSSPAHYITHTECVFESNIHICRAAVLWRRTSLGLSWILTGQAKSPRGFFALSRRQTFISGCIEMLPSQTGGHRHISDHLIDRTCWRQYADLEEKVLLERLSSEHNSPSRSTDFVGPSSIQLRPSEQS